LIGQLAVFAKFRPCYQRPDPVALIPRGLPDTEIFESIDTHALSRSTPHAVVREDEGPRTKHGKME